VVACFRNSRPPRGGAPPPFFAFPAKSTVRCLVPPPLQLDIARGVCPFDTRHFFLLSRFNRLCFTYSWIIPIPFPTTSVVRFPSSSSLGSRAALVPTYSRALLGGFSSPRHVFFFIPGRRSVAVRRKDFFFCPYTPRPVFTPLTPAKGTRLITSASKGIFQRIRLAPDRTPISSGRTTERLPPLIFFAPPFSLPPHLFPPPAALCFPP